MTLFIFKKRYKGYMGQKKKTFVGPVKIILYVEPCYIKSPATKCNMYYVNLNIVIIIMWIFIKLVYMKILSSLKLKVVIFCKAY